MPWWDWLTLFYIVSHGLVLLGLLITDGYEDNGFAWLNPLFIYRRVRVNGFGAALLAVIGNISVPGIALLYWMYKLCTIGRR